jgi:hypothetical protein
VPKAEPSATDIRWTTAVAAAIAPSTVQKRYRVANVIAINCDLSPSSATKITPKLSRKACTKGSPLGLGAGMRRRLQSRHLDPTP